MLMNIMCLLNLKECLWFVIYKGQDKMDIIFWPTRLWAAQRARVIVGCKAHRQFRELWAGTDAIKFARNLGYGDFFTFLHDLLALLLLFFYLTKQEGNLICIRVSIFLLFINISKRCKYSLASWLATASRRHAFSSTLFYSSALPNGFHRSVTDTATPDCSYFRQFHNTHALWLSSIAYLGHYGTVWSSRRIYRVRSTLVSVVIFVLRLFLSGSFFCFLIFFGLHLFCQPQGNSFRHLAHLLQPVILTAEKTHVLHSIFNSLSILVDKIKAANLLLLSRESRLINNLQFLNIDDCKSIVKQPIF